MALNKMLVYSKKIVKFINEIKLAIVQILSKEMRLKVFGERFYDKQQHYSYPIKVVIYNHKKMLAYFDPDFYELGFNVALMHSSNQQLHNIIRHELAHYMTFIQYGPGIQSHGAEFRAFCEKLGWGAEIYSATTCLDEATSTTDLEDSPILRKIQKLMALSSSSNKNEAELAMVKSQQLLLKHNIESKYIDDDNEEKIFLARVLKKKREKAKLQSIGAILSTFFVSPVFSQNRGSIHLEIVGNKINVEIAEYVAGFLDCEMDKLWNQARVEHQDLKGVTAKNSFFLGIARGYCNKINALKQDYTGDVSNALMIIEKKLMEAKEMVYPRLSSSKSCTRYCPESTALGEEVGRNLSINPALNSSSENLGKFLTFS